MNIRGESAYYAGRRVRPNQRGMQVQHTRVDFLPPRWNCAICKVGWRVPHRFNGSWHMLASLGTSAQKKSA